MIHWYLTEGINEDAIRTFARIQALAGETVKIHTHSSTVPCPIRGTCETLTLVHD